MVSARRIADVLRARRVTHVVSLPDNASAALLARLRAESAPPVVEVTREGEAFAIAAGLWAGGAQPVLLIQNTGLLESGDALRGTAMRMRVPLVCIVTCRGYATLVRTQGGDPDADTLGRPDVDSVAVLTEPTLRAWGIPFALVREDADLPALAEAFADAERRQQPVAVLLPGETA